MGEGRLQGPDSPRRPSGAGSQTACLTLPGPTAPTSPRAEGRHVGGQRESWAGRGLGGCCLRWELRRRPRPGAWPGHVGPRMPLRTPVQPAGLSPSWFPSGKGGGPACSRQGRGSVVVREGGTARAPLSREATWLVSGHDWGLSLSSGLIEVPLSRKEVPCLLCLISWGHTN